MAPTGVLVGMTRNRRITMQVVAVAAFVIGSLGIWTGSPAAAAGTDEPSPPPDALEYVRPLEDFVPKAADRRSIESAQGTRFGFFLDGERQGPWYRDRENRDGDKKHAEENIDRERVTELLTRAAALGKPLVLVGNHTPCRIPERECRTVLEGIGREATALDVRLIYVFTQRYEPSRSPEERTDYQHLKRIASLGHDMFVAAPSTGPLREGAHALAMEIQTMHAQGLFTPSGSTETTGSAVEAFTGQSDENGGIDFSSLELRYLAEPDEGGGLRYAFTAQPGSGEQSAGTGLATASQQSDAFFVWLSLPPSTFWVNLNPSEPDRVVDGRLGQTEVGRILLEADLELKRTVAQLIHPDTPTGAQFWSSLGAGDGSETCFYFRQWIVPAPASVYEDDGELYILDAPLTVQLESEYLDERNTGSPVDACPELDSATEERDESLFRSLVLPQIEQAVNEAPEYADLRRVYLSRVAAEWYRQRSLHHATSYGDLVDSGNVNPWMSSDAWSPRDVFDAYVDSYTNGEFDIARETQEGDVTTTNMYFYGGVDFTNLRFDELDLTAVDDRSPGLTRAVQDSIDRQSTDASGGLWIGSAVTPAAVPDANEPSTRPPATPADGPARLQPDKDATRPWLPVGVGVVAALAVARRIRVRRSADRTDAASP